MSEVTSFQVGRGSLTELLQPGVTWVEQSTLLAITAKAQKEPRQTPRAGTYPAYGGETPMPRSIPLNVLLLQQSATTREATFQTLVAILDSSPGLITVQWTFGGVTKRYLCAVVSVIASNWFHSAAAVLTAFNPVPEVV